MKKIFMASALAMVLAGCTHHTYSPGAGNSHLYTVPKSENTPQDSKPADASQFMVKLPELTGENQLSYMPNATAFKMSGNYANNVAISMAPDGTLIYFPAPTDITADSEPISLGDGWWLNNQGLGPNSVFTKYTFAEYAAFPETPSIEQLKLAVINGAKVTDFIELPFKVGDTSQNIEEIKNFIKAQ